MEDPYAPYRGSIIRRIRKSQDLTLANLAKKTGLSLSFLSQVERGITNP
ncbi:MAG: helix-turn-helix domain-containing protein [candidate division Zixibacteria bacterium]|nr:helix-turn-helix domain-containing protein [candidate division Zixibacteria bacterium]